MKFWNLCSRLQGISPKVHHRVDRLGHHTSQLGFGRLGIRLGHSVTPPDSHTLNLQDLG
jgi:hypothetical protein